MSARNSNNFDYAEVAERVLSHYPEQTLLTNWEKVRTNSDKRYKYKPQVSPEDSEGWEGFRKRGFMTREELKNLSRWKTGGRQQDNVSSNSVLAVEAVTRAAIRVDSEAPQEPGLPIEILKSLHGVDIPTASTVMTVWDPQRFGILDIRVWDALREAVPDVFRPMNSSGGYRLRFGYDDVQLCLGVFREIAARTSLTCRQIDAGLWLIDKERSG